MVRVVHLRVEHHDQKTIGIGEERPRISWSFEGDDADWTQQAYEIEVCREDGKPEEFLITSPQSTNVEWPCTPLISRENVEIRVRVTSTFGETSDWSTKAIIEAGLLNKNEWKCSLIEPTEPYAAKSPHRPVIFQRKLVIRSTVTKARLYITAHGIYEAKINGQRLGDQVLAPGWTSYQHRLVYQTLDATVALRKGQNTIEVEVAEGWHSGRLSWLSNTNLYSDRPGLIAILVVEGEDRQETTWGTDNQWQWTYSATTDAEIYNGEHYDARQELSDKTEWYAVGSKAISDNLVAPDGPPVRRIQEIQPDKVIISPSGKTIVDMGQNMVGWIRVRVSGPPHTTIRFHFTEVLKNGEAGTRPLRTAKCIDTVTLSGEGLMVWEPKFTFHGFRYVLIEDWPGDFDLSYITGIVIHTDMTRTGYFACSNPMIDKLHRNVVWSMRGNFISVPTDCPQRDERLGWTGDINAFADTANYLYDTTGMLSSWLKDLAFDQEDNGGIVPVVSPNIPLGLFDKSIQAVWGDCAIMLPWSIFRFTGDADVLARQYPSMELWLETIPRRENGLWDCPDKSFILGDWLDPAAPPNEPETATTDGTLVSDAFLVHVTGLMSEISSILNRKDDAKRYKNKSSDLRKAFQDSYITPLGLLACDSQTAYALAIQFSLFSNGEQIVTASARLATLIRLKSRFKISTGFAGTFLLGHACTKAGLSNLFYRMLLHRENPSWLYPVTMGATTIWERWDSMLPSGEINPGEMTSFNHYALGAVASWMHTTIAGLKAIEPGWKEFSIKPVPGGGLKWAEGKYISGYGECSVHWEIRPATLSSSSATEEEKKTAEEFWIRIRVPPNTTAQVKLPGSEDLKRVGSGLHEWSVPYRAPQSEGERWPPRAIRSPILPLNDELPDDGVLPYDEACKYQD